MTKEELRALFDKYDAARARWDSLMLRNVTTPEQRFELAMASDTAWKELCDTREAFDKAMAEFRSAA